MLKRLRKKSAISSKRTCRRRKFIGSWSSMRSNTRKIRSMRRISMSKGIGKRRDDDKSRKTTKN